MQYLCGTFSVYRIDVRLYFKRKERDKEEKMQGSGQFEIGGLYNIINTVYNIIYICDLANEKGSKVLYSKIAQNSLFDLNCSCNAIITFNYFFCETLSRQLCKFGFCSVREVQTSSELAQLRLA